LTITFGGPTQRTSTKAQVQVQNPYRALPDCPQEVQRIGRNDGKKPSPDCEGVHLESRDTTYEMLLPGRILPFSGEGRVGPPAGVGKVQIFGAGDFRCAYGSTQTNWPSTLAAADGVQAIREHKRAGLRRGDGRTPTNTREHGVSITCKTQGRLTTRKNSGNINCARPPRMARSRAIPRYGPT